MTKIILRLIMGFFFSSLVFANNIFANPALEFKKLNIAGLVTGCDGKPPAMAHVHLTEIGESYYQPLQSVETDSKGRFELEIKDSGLYQLWISAVSHEMTAIPLVLKDDVRKINFGVMLSPYTYQKFENVKIGGDWTNFDPRKAESMQRQPDGTFTFQREGAGESVSYQLVGIVANRSVNGTMADYFEYDRNGGYRSVLRVKPGLVEIVFDPAKLQGNAPDNLPRLSVDSKLRYLETIFEISNRFERKCAEYRKARTSYQELHGNSGKFSFDATELLSFLENLVRSEKNDKITSQVAAVYLSQMFKLGTKSSTVTTTDILKLVPPDSILWSIEPNAILMVANEAGKGQASELLKEFAGQNPNRRVRAKALASMAMTAKNMGESEKAKELYEELKSKYGDVRDVQYELTLLDSNKRIAQGKQVPEFKVKLLGSGETVSNRSLLGKYYLIDFWSVSCHGCKDELPFLHQVYQKYRDKGFEILSLSCDLDSEEVETFRKGTWKMPWLNAVVEGGIMGGLAKDFEVKSLPRPILVGPDGKIITTEGLRGEWLEKTLGRYLER